MQVILVRGGVVNFLIPNSCIFIYNVVPLCVIHIMILVGLLYDHR